MIFEQKINDVFEEEYNKAQEMLEKPDRIEKILKRLEKKLKGLPVLNDTLAYIPQMGLMIRSYIKNEYTVIPIGVIISILGAVLYFVMPVDLIPDFIPGVGYLDDAAVIGSVLMLVKSDVDEFMKWRSEQSINY